MIRKFYLLVIMLVLFLIFLFIIKEKEEIKTTLLVNNEVVNLKNEDYIKKNKLTINKLEPKKEKEKEESKSDILKNLIEQLKSNSITSQNDEKILIKYLSNNDDEDIYKFIISELKNNDYEESIRSLLQEYLLSLLVEVDTEKSVSIFLDMISDLKISDYNAIYSARNTIQRLSRSRKHLHLVKSTFEKISNDNIFLNELSGIISTNANKDDLSFLFSYISSKNTKKKQAVINNINLITNESLVPNFEVIIKNSTKEVEGIALTCLANMGQYEAASLLIKWSSKQEIEQLTKIKDLFEVATSRSPSTKRAIKKELNDYSFKTKKIKEEITKYIK